MKKLVLALFLAMIASIGALSSSSADTMSSATAPTATIVTPASLKWAPMKGLPGAWQAVVWGDPTKTGLYVMRLKLADGTKVAAHWHTGSERVTVLSGTLMFGVGNMMDVMSAYGPGTFIVIPAKVHHHAMAKGETIVQVGGNGPFDIHWVK
jgi:uncharacterized RmlC-like cupin family protein